MKQKRIVPDLRFNEFSSERIIKSRLENHIIGIKSGRSKNALNGNYVLMGSTGKIGFTDDKEISGKAILVARVGANAGTLKVVKGDYGVTDNTLIINDNENIVLFFLKDYLVFLNLNKYVFGSGQPLITGSILKRLIVNLPSLPEQQKIAGFLTAVDSKIQALTRRVDLLKDYKKGVMQKIFKQEIHFKNDNGREFSDWEERKLGDLTTKTGKKNKDRIKLPIYSINNKEGFLPQSDQFEGMDSNDRGYDITLYKIIKAKTFAYNPARINVGPIGYSNELNDVIISSLYVCFQTSKSLDDFYLLAYLDSYNFNKAVLRNVEGGVRQYLFYDNFSTIKIPLPSLKEQTKIANFLSSIDQKISAAEDQLDKLKEWKKGLLQKMFV